MRNRFRQHVVPHILHENPKAAERAVTMAGKLQEDEAYFRRWQKSDLRRLLNLRMRDFLLLIVDAFQQHANCFTKANDSTTIRLSL